MRPQRRTGEDAEAALLGDRRCWHHVGYAGSAYAPPTETYRGADAVKLNYTSHADTGRHPTTGPALGNLFPLVGAALYETAFAGEAGPLTTWSN